jgi:hypothetical protein
MIQRLNYSSLDEAAEGLCTASTERRRVAAMVDCRRVIVLSAVGNGYSIRWAGSLFWGLVVFSPAIENDFQLDFLILIHTLRYTSNHQLKEHQLRLNPFETPTPKR